MSIVDKSQQLRDLASTIRSNVLARDAIADAFELIADAMDGRCEDCGSTQAGAVIDPADNPEAGQDVDANGAAVIATTVQALAGEDNLNTGL